MKTKLRLVRKPSAPEDDSMSRLVSEITRRNLCVLDKTMSAIRCAPLSYAAAAARTNSIGVRVKEAIFEIGLTLPYEKR